ncbi:TPA: hypothetical protein ACOVFI_004298 [Citrobacter braakii]
MENKNPGITARNALYALLVQQTLQSWRFLLLFSVPPLIWGLFVVPLEVSGLIIVLLCAGVWIGCWRLWLDERYFRLINVENNALAGDILHVIWGRKKLSHLTYAQRLLGALKLFRYTLQFTGILWVVWLILWLADYFAFSSSAIL